MTDSGKTKARREWAAASKGFVLGAVVVGGFGAGYLGLVPSGEPDNRPAAKAIRLLESTVLHTEAMLHRELNAADVPAMLQGALSALDAQGGYIAPEYLRALRGSDIDSKTPYRVGVLGTPLPNKFVVETVAPGGPADLAGLRPGDRVVSISNKDMGSLPGQDVFDALLDAVEASVGAPVDISVLRGRETLALKMTPVQLPPFYAFDLGDKQNVAHIAVTAFYPGMTDSVRLLIEQALARGVSGVVLDFRGNGGGLVSETMRLLGLFEPRGTLAYIKEARGQVGEESRTRDAPKFPDVRLGVLIDEESASASEIFASAVQAHKRAVVVGTRSYGKGSIQTVFPLEEDAGAIKMTIGFYRDPLGRPIDAVGVSPDIEAPLSAPGPRPLYGEEDPGFTAAAEWVVSQDDIPTSKPTRPELVGLNRAQ